MDIDLTQISVISKRIEGNREKNCMSKIYVKKLKLPKAVDECPL